MKDLLQQAIGELTLNERNQCNDYLRFIQNHRNMQHEHFCEIPSHDLIFALMQLSEFSQRIAESYWDAELTVKGLA